MKRVIAIALTGLAVGACGDAQRANDSLCSQGVAVTYAGGDYCVYPLPIIETGFACPPDLQYAADGPGFVVCGHRDGLDEGETGVIGALGGSGCYAPMLDVLVVVDNSSSMCDEQRGLADRMDALALNLEALGGDIRFAVTTPDLGCDPEVETPTGQGVFNTTPATALPPPCQLHQAVACMDDGACQEVLGEGWRCRGPNTEGCVTNPNGSLNSRCVRSCTADEECVTATGDARAVCQKPSPLPQDWACIVPPPDVTCPAEIRSGQRRWLGTNELDSAACLTSVGVNQEKCFEYEQGLGAAWAALDPIGPNPIQSQEFLRPEANLMLVFVSDEDDCTVAYGQEIDEDTYSACALLPDTESGGPLAPVAELAERFRLLKHDRTVIVGAISGDSVASDATQRDADRAAYVASKGDPKVCYEGTTICEGAGGQAGYGARYFAFAEAFGGDGVVANLCAPDPFEDFVARLVARVTQIPEDVCHPR